MTDGTLYLDLPSGATFTINNEECVALERRGHDIWFEKKFDNERFKLTDKAVYALRDEGQFFNGGPDDPENWDLVRERKLVSRDAVAEKYTLELEQRREFIVAYEAAPYGEKTGEAGERRNVAIARRLGMAWAPDVRTVQQWRSECLVDGVFDENQLLAAHALGMERAPRLPALVREIMHEVLDEEFLQPWRPRLSRAHDVLERRLEARRKELGLTDKELPTPSLMTLRREITSGRWSNYHLVARRFGRDEAEHRFNRYRRGIQYEYPLQCVLVNSKHVDIGYIDDNGEKKFGLTKTALLDAASAMVIGYYLGPQAESYELVKRALLCAALPKDAIIAKHNQDALRENPEDVLRHPWPARDLAEKLLADPGSAHDNKHLLSAVGAFGMDLELGKKKHPHLRSRVERSFRTADTKFWHNLPGNRGSNVKDRKGREPEKNTVYTLAELRKKYRMFVVDDYHVSPHEGLGGKSPLQAWNEGIRKRKRPLPPTPEQLSVLLSHKAERALTREGVKIFNRWYWNKQFPGLLPLEGSIPVEVKWNPLDISQIWVIVRTKKDKRGRVLIARPEDYEQLKGVSQAEDDARRAHEQAEIQAGQPSPKERRLSRARLWDDKGKRDKKIYTPLPKYPVTVAPEASNGVARGPAHGDKVLGENPPPDIFGPDKYTSDTDVPLASREPANDADGQPRLMPTVAPNRHVPVDPLPHLEAPGGTPAVSGSGGEPTGHSGGGEPTSTTPIQPRRPTTFKVWRTDR